MGAGVILVEHLTIRNQDVIKSGLAIILFREKKSGRFSDAGGASECGESAEMCASRELNEESIGLFDVDLTMPWVSKYRVHLSPGYTSFVVPVKHCAGGINYAHYMCNLKSLEASTVDVPYFLKETDDMRWFFVDDIVKAGITSCTSGKAAHIKVPDVHNEYHSLTKRVACVIQRAMTMRVLTKRLHWNYLHMFGSTTNNNNSTNILDDAKTYRVNRGHQQRSF